MPGEAREVAGPTWNFLRDFRGSGFRVLGFRV